MLKKGRVLSPSKSFFETPKGKPRPESITLKGKGQNFENNSHKLDWNFLVFLRHKMFSRLQFLSTLTSL